jgi:hypothetical protein
VRCVVHQDRKVKLLVADHHEGKKKGPPCRPPDNQRHRGEDHRPGMHNQPQPHPVGSAAQCLLFPGRQKFCQIAIYRKLSVSKGS